MQPSFEYSITAMIKALSETVRPAVDGADKAAAEQLAIVIGSLSILREQIDFSHWFEVAEARDMADLVQALVAVVPLPSAAEAQAVAAQALAVADRHDVRLSTLRDANRALRASISLLMEQAFAAPDEVLRRKVETLVLDRSREQVTRERAYVAGARFDVFPESLRSIADALAAAD